MTKAQKLVGKERIDFSTHGARTVGYPYARKMNFSLHLVSGIKIS